MNRIRASPHKNKHLKVVLPGGFFEADLVISHSQFLMVRGPMDSQTI